METIKELLKAFAVLFIATILTMVMVFIIAWVTLLIIG
jgi:hypothetical protein